MTDEIKHPSLVVRDHIADAYTFDHHFGGLKMRRQRTLSGRFLQLLRQIKHGLQDD
jgi:hypothetical protein